MKQSTLLALIAPILALAKPLKHERLHKRHEITSTIYEEVTVTVDVTVTVYVPASEASASAGVTLDKPADNEAKPTGNVVAKVEASTPEPPKEAKKEETPKSTEVEAKSPIDHQKEQEELQEKQKQIQEDLIKQQEGHNAGQKGSEVKQPEVKQPETKQPEPTQEPKQPETKNTNTQSSGSAPSGGSCGEVGGKCLASDVTIYDDQGIGACGWQNDTNSEDYFALAAETFGAYTNDAPGPHKNKYCGRMATISVNGKQVQGMVTDKCPGCTGHSIDLSKCLWDKVFDGEAPTRKYKIEWWFSGPEVFSGPGA